MHICLGSVYGCSHTTIADWCSCDRLSGLQSLKYLLSGSVQTNFSDPVLYYDLSTLSPCLSLGCAIPKVHTSDRVNTNTTKRREHFSITFSFRFVITGILKAIYFLLGCRAEMQMQSDRKKLCYGSILWRFFWEKKSRVDLRQEDNLEDTSSDSGIRCRSLNMLGYLWNDYYIPNLSHETNCFSRKIFEKNKNKWPVIIF